MKLDLTFAELHAPLFLGGKNHAMKLKEAPDLRLQYDRAEKELLVFWTNSAGEHEAVIPASNVSCMWPKKVEKAEVAEEKAPEFEPLITRNKPGPKPKSAQVESPTDHVFAGPGKGKR